MVDIKIKIEGKLINMISFLFLMPSLYDFSRNLSKMHVLSCCHRYPFCIFVHNYQLKTRVITLNASSEWSSLHNSFYNGQQVSHHIHSLIQSHNFFLFVCLC